MLDTLRRYEIFKAASLSDEHARAMTLALQKTESEIGLDIREMIREEFDHFSRTFVTKAEMEARLAQTDARVAQVEARLMRWMFIFWMGQTAVTVGLIFEVAKLFK
jgi:hypothetical protein